MPLARSHTCSRMGANEEHRFWHICEACTKDKNPFAEEEETNGQRRVGEQFQRLNNPLAEKEETKGCLGGCGCLSLIIASIVVAFLFIAYGDPTQQMVAEAFLNWIIPWIGNVVDFIWKAAVVVVLLYLIWFKK